MKCGVGEGGGWSVQMLNLIIRQCTGNGHNFGLETGHLWGYTENGV